MIFHPPWKDRVAYLIVLTVCTGLVLFCGFQVARGARSPMGSYLQPLGVTSFLLAMAVYLNWIAYSAFVKVTDAGLEWKDMVEKGVLTWAEIQGIGFKQYPKFAKPGLVLRATQELKFLPFFSPALYAALRDRCGRLPAEIERSLDFRA